MKMKSNKPIFKFSLLSLLLFTVTTAQADDKICDDRLARTYMAEIAETITQLSIPELEFERKWTSKAFDPKTTFIFGECRVFLKEADDRKKVLRARPSLEITSFSVEYSKDYDGYAVTFGVQDPTIAGVTCTSGDRVHLLSIGRAFEELSKSENFSVDRERYDSRFVKAEVCEDPTYVENLAKRLSRGAFAALGSPAAGTQPNDSPERAERDYTAVSGGTARDQASETQGDRAI